MTNLTAENRTGGYADLFLTALCWSFVGLFTRSNACSAWLTSAVASLSGLLFLLVVVRPTLRFTKRAVLVGLASCVTSLTFIFANKLTSVGNAIVLQYSSTIFVIIYESIERRHLPHASKTWSSAQINATSARSRPCTRVISMLSFLSSKQARAIV